MYFTFNDATLHAHEIVPEMDALRLIATLLCLCLTAASWGQSADAVKKDDKVGPKPNAMFNIILHGNVDWPMGDMADRFGQNYRMGLTLQYKSKANIVLGLKGELITGNKIHQDSLMCNLLTSQGGVIAQVGDVLNVGTFERGYLVGATAGKIFPLNKKNPNSGIITTVSAGFMQHKIKLFDRDLSFPQLRDGYTKGYDRLSNGAYAEGYLGYIYYAKNKLINFTAGVDWVWGFTQGRRDYLYDVARADHTRRNDILLGFKAGWIIPIYKKITEDTFY